MAITGKVLYRGQPGTTESTLYTVPASTTTVITGIVLANTTATDATVSLSVVPSGGTAGAANRILEGVTVSAKSSFFIDGLSLPMATGDFISGLQGTAGAITVTISGVEEA